MRRSSENVLYPIGNAEERVPWPRALPVEAVIAALEPFATDSRRARLEAVLASRLECVTLVMDSPHDPHNGGAVLRSADAFGLARVHIVARREAFALSTTVTRGSEKWVDLDVHATAGAAIAALGEAGFTLVRTHPEGELLPEDLVNVPRLALVLGNERDGICAELEGAAERSVRVPMRGFVESLNVSVSAAVLLAAATRNRPGDLSKAARERLYALGLFRSVAKAEQILLASPKP